MPSDLNGTSLPIKRHRMSLQRGGYDLSRRQLFLQATLYSSGNVVLRCCILLKFLYVQKLRELCILSLALYPVIGHWTYYVGDSIHQIGVGRQCFQEYCVLYRVKQREKWPLKVDDMLDNCAQLERWTVFLSWWQIVGHKTAILEAEKQQVLSPVTIFMRNLQMMCAEMRKDYDNFCETRIMCTSFLPMRSS